MALSLKDTFRANIGGNAATATTASGVTGTLTVQKNGATVVTFNGSANKTANIVVPTKTSELTNNSGFITNSVSDLTNYYTNTIIDGKMNGKQNTLVAGTNIVINGNTISASSELTGNVETATKLKTARKINGVAFDGSANITIPVIRSSGPKTVTASGDTASSTAAEITQGNGISMIESYNDSNTPINYGNIINVMGNSHLGGGQLLLGWPGTDAVTEKIYYRSHRDTSSGGWGPWKQLAYTDSNITGNAATATTATKLATARTIALSNDITGSASFDGSGNITISALRKGASVGQTSNSATNPWYKVASCELTKGYENRWIQFSVTQGYATGSIGGILKANIRSNSNKQFESGILVWITKTTGINLADFVLAYKNETNKLIVEIWAKCSRSYNGWHFDVMGEGTRNGRQSRKWVMYNTWSQGSQAALPTGYTTMNSTSMTIDNPINNVLLLTGGTMSGTISSSKSAGTYLAGNQGQAIINSTAANGSYTMLAKMNSTNGKFTIGSYNTTFMLYYTSNETITAGTNATTKSAKLLDEAGNSTFPGTVTASAFSGNASSATKLATARTINGVSFNGTANIEIPVIKEGSSSTSTSATQLTFWIET